MSIIIDSDPGVDDAIAIAYASQVSDIEAITTVAGNSKIEDVTENTLFLVDLLGLDTEVYQGSSHPLERNLETAESHGENGLGNLKIKTGKEEAKENAVETILEKASEENKLVCLGPLTNVAKAIRKNPEVLMKYEEVIIMGGAIQTSGNANRVAEFNFWVDPEAADKVIQSKGKKKVVPVNICRKVTLDFPEKLPSTFEKIIKPYREYYREKEDREAVMYDPLTVIIALNPELGSLKQEDIVVETEGKYTRGMAVKEEREKKKESDCRIYNQIEEQKIETELKTTLKSIEQTPYRGS